MNFNGMLCSKSDKTMLMDTVALPSKTFCFIIFQLWVKCPCPCGNKPYPVKYLQCNKSLIAVLHTHTRPHTRCECGLNIPSSQSSVHSSSCLLSTHTLNITAKSRCWSRYWLISDFPIFKSPSIFTSHFHSVTFSLSFFLPDSFTFQIKHLFAFLQRVWEDSCFYTESDTAASRC